MAQKREDFASRGESFRRVPGGDEGEQNNMGQLMRTRKSILCSALKEHRKLEELIPCLAILGEGETCLLFL